MLRKLLASMLDYLRRQTLFDVVLTIAGIAGLSVLLIGDGSCMGYPHNASVASASTPQPQGERTAPVSHAPATGAATH